MKNLSAYLNCQNILASVVACILICMNGGAKAQATSKLSIQLLLNQSGGSQNTADGLVAVFGPNFSEAIAAEDSYKFVNPYENIAINRNGTKLSIEGRPTISNTDTLPLLVWKLKQSSYCLQLDAQNFPANVTALVKDAYLQQDFPVNIAGKTVLPFSLTANSASFAANRFCIVLRANTTLPIIFSNCVAQRKNRDVQINWTFGCQTNVDHFVVERSTDGKNFIAAATIHSTRRSCAEAYNWVDGSAANGTVYYRVVMVENSGYRLMSRVIKINGNIAKEEFQVWPNPVTGRAVSVQLQNIESGSYQLQLSNLQGQIIYKASANVSNGSEIIKLTLQNNTKAGMYNLQLKKQNFIASQMLIIQ